MALTTLKDVERQIMATGLGRLSIGDVAPAPGTNTFIIERTLVEEIISSAESMITARIGRFYSTPLSLDKPKTIKFLREIATKEAAYQVWLTINPALTTQDLPAAVREWKAYVEAMIEGIVPKGKTSAVQGRDIILEGETLLTDSDDPGRANVEFTTLLPWG
uniref:Uncharacterized protein n=2 Tax=viral metagenome TaxID=1070528 RepID=A0A6M3JCS9_9ZZZZ